MQLAKGAPRERLRHAYADAWPGVAVLRTARARSIQAMATSASQYRWVSRQVSRDGAGQDRLGIHRLDDALYVVLCDGAGGIPGGDRAADLAVSSILCSAPAEPAALWPTVDRMLVEDPWAGEATCVLARADGTTVSGASCGDSAAFVDGQPLTRGQHKKRLGSGAVQPVHFRGTGRRLLLCSDGLVGVAQSEAIGRAMMTPNLDEAARQLTRLGRGPSGQLFDDLTFVLVQLGATRPP